VILITTNYRLGVFGFLGSDALRTRDPSGSTGNYGIQDQRAAIQWVHDNIAAFGGNPDLITIFGESAGAGSVSTLLVAPRSKGMFQRAIMESGPLAQWVGMPYHYSQVKYQQVLEYVGCNSSSVTAQLSCLEGVDANTLQSSEGHIMDGLLQWAPVIDGVELTDLPENLAAEGKFSNRVPVLMGTNRDEGTLFVPDAVSHDASAAQMLAWLQAHWGETNGTLVYNQYDPSNYPSPWWALTHVIGDAAMSCAARRSGRWLNAAGTGPVYIYFFQHELEVIKLFVPDYGVCHASDVAMVFNLKVGLWGKGEETLAQQFGKYWTTFAKNGDPNSAATPEWAPYDSETDNYQVLDIPISNTTALKKEVCDFWDQMPVSETFIWADHNVPTMPGLFLEALRRLSRP
jgi:para-nitrobenzyl esterase